jgi:hypothetical protein
VLCPGNPNTARRKRPRPGCAADRAADLWQSLGFLVPEARLSGSGSFRHPRQERDGAADDLTARLDDPSERPQTNAQRTCSLSLWAAMQLLAGGGITQER